VSDQVFDKPLNTWIEEEIEIPSMEPIIDKRGNVAGVKQRTTKATRKTHYSKLSDPQKMSCFEKDHSWYIPDPHIHIAHCKNCVKKQYLRAVFEKIVDGKIIDRDTLIQIV